MRIRISGGFGSAGAGNSTGRKIRSAVGLGQTAKERNRRQLRVSADGSLLDPTREELAESIRVWRCWWCGADRNKDGKEMKSLSGHWTRAHGIELQHVRDILGVEKRTSFIAESTRESFSQRGKRLYDPVRLRNKGGPRQLSAYGIAVNRAKSEAQIRKHGKGVITERLAAEARKHAIARRRFVTCVECGREFWQKEGGKGHRGAGHRLTCSLPCRTQRKSRLAKAQRERELSIDETLGEA